MANHKTGAQRYNDRMDKIFETSKRLNEKNHGEDRGLYRGNGKYAGSKKKDVAKKMKVGHSDERHLLYRTFKSKDDYEKMHLKSTTIHPSKKKGFDKKHADDLLKYETN